MVSLDIIEKPFSCDLPCCKGMCCVEGEAGAPISEQEEVKIREALPVIVPLMQKKSLDIIENQGLTYRDESGERVLAIVNGRECVFTDRDERGLYYCILQKLYNQGQIDFVKPMSCRLYPIREVVIGANGKARRGIEYHRWDVCEAARLKGKKTGVKVYEYLKEPLSERFGTAWFEELDLTAKEWAKQCKQK